MRARVEVGQRVALLLRVGEGAADGERAGAGPGLREVEAHDGFFSLDVQPRVLPAVKIDTRLHDRVRLVVEEAQEQGTAHAALLARTAGRRRLKRLAADHPGGVEARRRQRELEHAGEVEELHVVRRFDRHHVLIDVVGVAAVGDVVVVGGVVVVRPVERVLVDLHTGADDCLGDVVEVQHVDRAGDADVVAGRRGLRPGVQQVRLQSERAVEIAVHPVESFGGDFVAEFAGGRRHELVGSREVRIRDVRDDPQGAEGVHLGPALDDRLRGVVLEAEDDRGADAALCRLSTRLAVRAQRLPDEAVGVQLQFLDQLGSQFHVVVRVQVGGAADQRLHDVVRVRERQCARDSQRGGVGRGRAGGGAGRPRGRAGECRRGRRGAGGGGEHRPHEPDQVFERRAARLRVEVSRLLGAVVGQLEQGEVRRCRVGQTGRGAGAVGRVEPAEDAEGGEVRVENLRRAQGVPGGPGGDGTEVNSRDPAAGFVLQGTQADRLRIDQPVVAGQVELIDAGHDVVDVPVHQSGDGGGALVVDDGLAQLEGVADAAERDRVLARIDGGGVEPAGVQRHL